jgi:hypothetical protein
MSETKYDPSNGSYHAMKHSGLSASSASPQYGAQVMSSLFGTVEERSRERALNKWKESLDNPPPSVSAAAKSSFSSLPASNTTISSRARIEFISKQLDDAEGDFEKYVGTLFKDLNDWNSPAGGGSGGGGVDKDGLHYDNEFEEISFEVSPVKQDNDEKYYREKCKKLEQKVCDCIYCHR